MQTDEINENVKLKQCRDIRAKDFYLLAFVSFKKYQHFGNNCDTRVHWCV